ELLDDRLPLLHVGRQRDVLHQRARDALVNVVAPVAMLGIQVREILEHADLCILLRALQEIVERAVAPRDGANDFGCGGGHQNESGLATARVSAISPCCRCVLPIDTQRWSSALPWLNNVLQMLSIA